MREAFVIGSGPNGLTAAITLAQAGIPVTVLEAQPTLGGGSRSAALTLPGFLHDVCSAVHPFAISSPAFSKMPLSEHGLEWIQPPLPVAHPLDGGEAAFIERSVALTAARFGKDAAEYHSILAPLAAQWPKLVGELLAPPHFPRHPLLLARFGMLAAWSSGRVARTLFREEGTRALFAGMSAHSVTPLESPGSAAFGFMFSLSAHAAGWPIPRGGSQRIADALISYLRSLGGTVHAHQEVRSLRDLPKEALILCDITPRQLLRIAAGRLPDHYCRLLERYRYGPGIFKMDWALSAPIPWQNTDCARAGTIHLGGTFGEVAASERAAWEGSRTDRPFVLLAQPSLFDPSRAPAGQHTAWAYCHIPNGSNEDYSAAIEAQVERFAPGFRRVILARHMMGPAQLEAHNANLVGGDIAGGAVNLGQLFLRPTARLYRTPSPGLFFCSSSTPPGPGVHGMCGYYSAKAALGRGGN